MPACSENSRCTWLQWRLAPIANVAGRTKSVIRALVASTFTAIVLWGCDGQFPTDSSKLQAAEARYDAALLTNSLDAIAAWHATNKTGVAGYLSAGKNPASIEEAFKGSACKPTEELKALWSWRDGGIGPTPFVWYHDFLPLDDALSAYKWLRINPLARWDPQYVPILAFQGEWYAAYCGPDSVNAGPIAHYFLEDEPRIVSVNLTVFMAGMAEALQSSAVQWKDGAMVDDIHQMHSIHQRRNPGYPFPYYVPTKN